jgi:hypothetical protein
VLAVVMLVTGMLAAFAMGVLLAVCSAMAMEAREVCRRTMSVVAAIRVTRAFVSGVFRDMVEVRPVSAASIARVPARTMRTAVGVKTASGKMVAVPCARPTKTMAVMGKAVMRPMVMSPPSEFTRPWPVMPPGVEARVAMTGKRESAKPWDRMSMPREIRTRAASCGAIRAGRVVAMSGEIAVMAAVTAMRRVIVVRSLAVPFSGLLAVMLP